MQPLAVPTKPWEGIAMDFITDLPRTDWGHSGIFVVIDHFSKMAHFLPIGEDTSAKEISRIYF